MFLLGRQDATPLSPVGTRQLQERRGSEPRTGGKASCTVPYIVDSIDLPTSVCPSRRRKEKNVARQRHEKSPWSQAASMSAIQLLLRA